MLGASISGFAASLQTTILDVSDITIQASSDTTILDMGNITVLESFQESDINDDYISWLNDKKIVRFSNQRFISHNRETSKSFFDSFTDSPNYFFKISDKNTMQSIGTITLYVNPNHGLQT